MRVNRVGWTAAAVFGGALALGGTTGVAQAQSQLDPVIGASLSSFGDETYVFQCLMGAVTNTGQMLGYEEVAAAIKSRSTVAWFDLSGGLGTGTSGPAHPMEAPCDFGYTTDATLAADADGAFVGVAGRGAMIPSVLRLHSPQSQTYTAAAADYFRSIGHVTNSVTLTQVIRTDLEGDGVEEVILTVQDDADGIPSTIDAGDHAAILLRRVVNGAVETIVVDGEFYEERQDFAAPVTYEVFAVADLNGDGTMEIVATVDYYEGSSFAVFEVVGSGARLAMACGCGA